MNWYIGQDIVAIKEHSQNKFKKGDTFTIKGLKISECKCKNVSIDIGIKGYSDLCHCNACNFHFKNQSRDGIWWFSETRFAPLDSLVNTEEIQNLIEESLYQKK